MKPNAQVWKLITTVFISGVIIQLGNEAAKKPVITFHNVSTDWGTLTFETTRRNSK